MNLRGCLLSLPLGLLGALFALQSFADDELQSLLEAPACTRFEPLREDELKRAEALFTDLLRGGAKAASGASNRDGHQAAWLRLGFVLSHRVLGGQAWQVLAERPGSCRGQGLYLIKAGAAHPFMIQAPHRYHDLHTGDLAGDFARAGLADVIAWNSVARSTRGEDDEGSADLAHREDHLLQALTRAYAEVEPRARVVQLHGFSRAKRKTDAAASADVILSPGARYESPGLAPMAACLRQLYPHGLRLYPREVHELGGTRNAQGRALRSRGHTGFVHLELSREARRDLSREAGLRDRFMHCVAGTFAQEAVMR